MAHTAEEGDGVAVGCPKKHHLSPKGKPIQRLPATPHRPRISLVQGLLCGWDRSRAITGARAGDLMEPLCDLCP